MKTLNTIQTLAKIGRIISKVIFILSLVGGIGCIVGIITTAVIPDGIKLGGVTIRGLVEQNAHISMGTLYATMAMSVILCAGEAVLCRISENYFKHELAAGTPFTFDGAKELMRFGICTICIPVGTAILSGITYGIMKACLPDVADLNLHGSFSIGLGVMFIVMSLFCRCGAEQNEQK